MKKSLKKALCGLMAGLMVAVTVPAALPEAVYVAEVQAAAIVATPKLVSAKASGKSKIVFKWNAVKGASGYTVFRKEKGGKWKNVAEVKGEKKTAFSDTKGRTGTKYTYSVKAFKNTKGKKTVSSYNKKGVTAIAGLYTLKRNSSRMTLNTGKSDTLKVNGTKLTLALLERVRRALLYLEENPGTKAVLSGGRGDGERISGAATLGAAIDYAVPAAYRGACLFPGVNHLTIRYDRVLKEGLEAYKRDITARLALAADGQETAFLRSLDNVVEALRVWHARYLDAVREEKPAVYRALQRVPFAPALKLLGGLQGMGVS